MSAVAEKTDPDLWDKVKSEVTQSDRGGHPGQWSARKAQLATQEYKRKGGGYRGRKAADNHLREWTRKDWGTKSGRKSQESGERYLPKQAREHLTAEEYARSTRKKRADTRRGKQFSAQPKDVAAKTAADRASGRSVGRGSTSSSNARTTPRSRRPGPSRRADHRPPRGRRPAAAAERPSPT